MVMPFRKNLPNKTGCVSEVTFEGSYPRAVSSALEAIQAAPVLRKQSRILVKPNLINASPPPITTPVACVAAVVDYIREHAPLSEVIVAEGCGAKDAETGDIYRELGYGDFASDNDVELLDLNYEKTVTLRDARCSVFPEFHLPRIAQESFILSVPVLKAHTLAEVTLTMKNMLGFAPPAYYDTGGWKKSAFHARIQQSILELNKYRSPDLSVLDATVGMPEGHLGGSPSNPPINRILTSFDPVALDAAGSSLLDIDWRKVGHIADARGTLGNVPEATE